MIFGGSFQMKPFVILRSFMLYKKQAFYKMFSFCYVFNDSFATTLAVWYFQISSSLILSQNTLQFFPGYCILIMFLTLFLFTIM